MKGMKQRTERDEGNEGIILLGKNPTHRCYVTVRKMMIKWINKRNVKGDKVRKG
jgi:hypothetical protein